MRNVIVFGVGHSGTTILTRMLNFLGWNVAWDNDPEYFEPICIRDCNDAFLATGVLPEVAKKCVDELPTPWVLKDPRFMVTLPQWYDLLFPHEPLLLWIMRDIEAVKESYRRRGEVVNGEPQTRGYSIEEAVDRCRILFERWPLHKQRIEYESLGAACRLWDR